MKKRLIAIVLAVVMLFATAACASKTSGKKDASSLKSEKFTPDKAYTEKTVTNTQKGEEVKEEVPYDHQKVVTVTNVEEVFKDEGFTEDDLINVSVDNSKAVQTNWMGLNAVYQGFIFIPDTTKLGRTYTQKMIDRELQRIDEMDITLLRSYFEPSYSYIGGDVTDPHSWDFSKSNPKMRYLYQWIEALQQRNVIVALNMGWSLTDLSGGNAHTACSAENPFYKATYSQAIKGYAYWYSESLKWIVKTYGYTNVKYTFNYTEPLYYDYSFKSRVEYPYTADPDVTALVVSHNPSAAGKTLYMAKIGDAKYVCDRKTCYNGTDEDGYKIPSFPNFYDIKTGKKHDLTEADKCTARVYTGWDMWLDAVGAANDKCKADGTRSLVKFVGPDVANGNKIHMSVEKSVKTGKSVDMNIEDDINWWINHANHILDVYSFHYYLPSWPGVGRGTATIYDVDYDLITDYYDRYVKAVKKTGKPFWFDEFNYNIDTGENRQHYDDIYAENPINPDKLAEATIAMMNTGVQTGLLWQLFDTVWPYRDGSGDEFVSGIHVIGMAPAMCKSSIPFISYYGFTLLTKYCGMSGSTVYKGEGQNDVMLSMTKYKKNGKTYQSVIVLNMNFTEKPVDIKFAKSLGGAKMYRYLYNPYEVEADSSATMIDADTCFTGVKDRLQDVIPAFSFAIYSTEYHVNN